MAERPGDWQIVHEREAEDAVTSPGARLREARERSGWTLEGLAAELKLSPSRIVQLEADDFGAFGPPVFVRGYLRRYAALLKVPADHVIHLYEARQGGEPSAETAIGPAPGRPPRRDRSGWVGPAFATLAVAAVLAGGWWFFAPRGDAPPPSADRPAPDSGAPLTLQPPAPAELARTPEPPPTTLAETSGDDPGTEPLEAGGEPLASAGDAAQQGADDAPAAGEIPAEPAPTVADSLAAGPAGDDVGPGPVVEARQAEIRIELSADCWLDVTDAEGRKLIYRLGREGQVIRLSGTAPLSVFLGNAGGVDLSVDGEPVAVRPAARRDGTARLTVGGGAG